MRSMRMRIIVRLLTVCFVGELENRISPVPGLHFSGFCINQALLNLGRRVK
jgi:hypothetical protein